MSFLYCRPQCTELSDGTIIKDLRRITEWSDTLLIDDNRYTYQFNNHNKNNKIKKNTDNKFNGNLVNKLVNKYSVYRIKAYTRYNPGDKELQVVKKKIKDLVMKGLSLSSL